MFIFAPVVAWFVSTFAGGFLKGLVEIGTLVIKYVLELLSWYLSTFWKGLGVIFQNLSTLAVILAVALGSAWYFKSWDNDKVLKECIKTCPNPVPNKKYEHPLKKKIYGNYIPKIKAEAKKATSNTKSFLKPFNNEGGN